jgi:hypothetical protein
MINQPITFSKPTLALSSIPVTRLMHNPKLPSAYVAGYQVFIERVKRWRQNENKTRQPR